MTDSPEKVGYKRPPAETRFRPGRSGNPSGRPRRRPDFKVALLAELAEAMPDADRTRRGGKPWWIRPSRETPERYRFCAAC
jgi:hypothetical protein